MGLNQIREEIDQIDKKLRELFLQRMELSDQVAETKMKTKEDVYVPKREQEILHLRTEGVKEEFLPECRAFFEQIMEIGRTYQYSKMAEENELLTDLPPREGVVKIRFSYPCESRQLPVFVNAAVLAGLRLEQAETEMQSGSMRCSLQLRGDFSKALSRAAVLQALKESGDFEYTFVPAGNRENRHTCMDV